MDVAEKRRTTLLKDFLSLAWHLFAENGQLNHRVHACSSLCVISLFSATKGLEIIMNILNVQMLVGHWLC
jgi:hypothetical protein